MTKQPEALRLADVLIGSPQFSGTPIWQAADMLRRQHAEITALRNALEQSAPAQCKHCTKFFSKYRCNASQGECDCPKCQGFCTCSQKTEVVK